MENSTKIKNEQVIIVFFPITISNKDTILNIITTILIIQYILEFFIDNHFLIKNNK